MNIQAPMGHNNPPDPIDEATAPFHELFEEAGTWADGEPITTIEQEKALDKLIKSLRSAKSAVGKAEKETVGEFHKAWKSEKDRWKPTLEDIQRRLDACVAIGAPFKKAEIERREAEKREAYRVANEERQKLEAARQAANAANLEEQEALAEQHRKALDAQRSASKANKNTVKGTRLVHKFEITDLRELVNWIAKNDKDAMADFARAYAAKNHKTKTMDGVNSWPEQEAY